MINMNEHLVYLKNAMFSFMFWLFLFLMVFIIAISISRWYPEIQVDEIIYGNIVRDWNQQGISALADHADNKPITFLYLQKILKADETVLYTRILNLMLVVCCSTLIYSLTKRYESYLFIIIPMFLSAMWLTVEIIELMFILLAIRYKRHAGVFVGLAAIFRPYAVLYSVLLKRNQLHYVFEIGLLFSGLLLYLGLFSTYLNTVLAYGQIPNDWLDKTALSFLVVFGILGTNSKEIFKYGLIACIPLFIRLWGHYFITPYGLFFMGYLCDRQKKDKVNVT